MVSVESYPTVSGLCTSLDTMSSKQSFSDLVSAVEKLRESKLNKFKKKVAHDPNFINSATNTVLKKLIDDITLEIIGEHYRSVKLGYNDFMFYPSEDSITGVNKMNDDKSNKKTDEIKCPNCTRLINALRFACHLSVCMGGGGRNSSRLASKRIANSSRSNMYGSVPTDDEDDERNIEPEKPAKPTKKHESLKRKKHLKQKNNTPSKNDTEDNTALIKMKNLSVEERLAFLSTNCGAKVDSGTLCSKPPKCKSHTEVERTITRKLLSSSLLDSVVPGNFINIQDLDLPSLESEMEQGVSLSPADSNSSSSSSSYKRKSK